MFKRKIYEEEVESNYQRKKYKTHELENNLILAPSTLPTISNIPNLPNLFNHVNTDSLIHIFNYLSPKQLVNIALTCQKFYFIVNENIPSLNNIKQAFYTQKINILNKELKKTYALQQILRLP